MQVIHIYYFLSKNGDLYGLGRNGGGNIGTFGTGNNTHLAIQH